MPVEWNNLLFSNTRKAASKRQWLTGNLYWAEEVGRLSSSRAGELTWVRKLLPRNSKQTFSQAPTLLHSSLIGALLWYVQRVIMHLVFNTLHREAMQAKQSGPAVVVASVWQTSLFPGEVVLWRRSYRIVCVQKCQPGTKNPQKQWETF